MLQRENELSYGIMIFSLSILMKSRYRGYKYRIYPTVKQEQVFVRWFGSSRYVWNWALETWNARYHVGIQTSGFALKKELTELKHHPEMLWLAEVPSGTSYIPLNLDQAWKRFFKKLGGKPNFKAKHHKQSFPCTGIKIFDRTIKLPKIKETIKARIHRKIPSNAKIKSTTLLKTKSGKYFVALLVEELKPVIRKAKSTNTVGMDTGLTLLITLSDGAKIERPKHLIKAEKKLKRKQRQLACKKKGSKNRNKARVLLAVLHEKVAHKRRDFTDKLTRTLADENQVIYSEDLSVSGMCRGLPNLRKHLHDASLGMIYAQLEYKLEERAGKLVKIDRFTKSSGVCPKCGCIDRSLTLADREWKCNDCGMLHDRDVAAAQVIKIIGQGMPESTPAERRTATLSMKSIAQVRSLKQEATRTDA